MSSVGGRKRRRMDNKAPRNICRPFSFLPNELTMDILDRLDIITKIRLRRVCNKWNCILRDDSMLKTVEIDESILQKQCGWMADYYLSYGHLFDKLAGAGAWKSLRHLVYNGGYDILNQEPHGHWKAVETSAALSNLMYNIHLSKPSQNVDVGNLKTLVLHRTAVDLLDFEWFENENTLRCKLILSSSSVIFEIDSRCGTYGIEFEVEGSKSFELSGYCEELDYDPYPLLPVEISQFVQQRLELMPTEQLPQLGELYSVLLKGRPGMIIRYEVRRLFFLMCHDHEGFPYDEHDPERRHWQQCKNYDFQEQDKMHKYALLYYTRPRNCYQLVTTQSPEDVEDLCEL